MAATFVLYGSVNVSIAPAVAASAVVVLGGLLAGASLSRGRPWRAAAWAVLFASLAAGTWWLVPGGGTGESLASLHRAAGRQFAELAAIAPGDFDRFQAARPGRERIAEQLPRPGRSIHAAEVRWLTASLERLAGEARLHLGSEPSRTLQVLRAGLAGLRVRSDTPPGRPACPAWSRSATPGGRRRHCAQGCEAARRVRDPQGGLSGGRQDRREAPPRLGQRR